jgi:TPP-dependent pyruvate/acetoin dehydrogenase alpha subunit
MQCKKVTDGKVEGFYQLLAGEEAVKHVKALTNEDQDYIYPLHAVGFPLFASD